MNIRKLMTRQVRTCSPGDPLHMAAGIMWAGDCGIVPVVDGDRKPVGVVTDRDLCMAAWSKDRRLAEVPVSEVMQVDLLTCNEHDSIEAVMTRMRERGVRRMPIVDRAGRLCGIVSMSDIVRAIEAEKDASRRVVEAEEFVHALSGVCTPRCAPQTQSQPTPPLAGFGLR